MSGDSIEDGDIIIIDCSKNSNASPKQGEMVVARVNEDTATLKRFYKKGNKIELHPSNKKYSALKFNFSSSNQSLSKGKKLDMNVWYDEKTLIWLKASYKKQGNWEYRIKNIE